MLPLVVLLAVSGTTYALAKWHPAKPGLPKISGSSVVLGDQYRGETVFQASCAGCHGQKGKGGGIGPKLQGLAIPLAVAKAQIDAGGTTMPARLVSGKQEADVLAFLDTILGH